MGALTLTLQETLFPVRGYDCDSIHRQVQTLVPAQKRAEARLLYRLEGPVARVRTPVVVGPDSRPVEVELAAGRRYLFHLRANVTKKVHPDGRKNGMRVPDKDWTGWLLRHQFGWVAREVWKRMAPKAVGRKPDGLPLTFTGVDYHGILECTDPAELARCLIDGLGPGKPYGFGMLMVEPLCNH